MFQWTNPKWIDFYEKCKNAIETFDVLVIRVHDIYANRILNVLTSMQEVALQTLPSDDELWTIEEFLEKNEESCRYVHSPCKESKFIRNHFLDRLAAIELNRKSQMVSEAVEEVLNLVQDATQTFKSMMSTESADLPQGKYFRSILFMNKTKTIS